MAKLALLGGKPVRSTLFPAYNFIDAHEKEAVMKVLDSGVLSQFLGSWHEDFWGGQAIRQFEKAWAQKFNAKHAITVNSNTSGLYAAMGACGIGPGDEVIVSPYSMSASAVAPMVYGAVPVFADIEPDIFCMDPKSIKAKITARTKAILVVHIFGHPADMDEIMAIAKENELFVIEDCAQVPMATYKGKNVGTIGDIGIFSLNYHKHIHTGEGGVITTNNDVLAERLQLIRNHAESVVDAKGTKDFDFPLGFNFRMTEVEAAIGFEQLKKLDELVEKRIANAKYLENRLKQFSALTMPITRPNCRHVFYLQSMKFKSAVVGIHRNTFIAALKAEIPTAILRETTPLIGCGYVKPLYLLSVFHSQSQRAPYNSSLYKGQVNYERGSCPVVERMHFDELFYHEFMRASMSREDLDDVVRGYEKVFENINELKEYESKQNTENLSRRS